MTNTGLMFDAPARKGTALVMHKVIRKRIRHDRDGVNIAADIDAVIAINTGQDAGVSQTTARSSHVVVQGAAARRSKREASPTDADDSTKEKP